MATKQKNNIHGIEKETIKIPSHLKKEYDSVNNELAIIGKVMKEIRKWNTKRRVCLEGNADKNQLIQLQEQGHDLHSKLNEISHLPQTVANKMSDSLWKIMEPRIVKKHNMLAEDKKIFSQKLKTINDRLLTPEQRTFKKQIHAAKNKSQLKNNLNDEVPRRIKNKNHGLEKQ